MEGREKELRKMALKSKADREKALESAMAQESAAVEANEADKKDPEPSQPSKKDGSENSSEEEKEESEDSVSTATDSSVVEADEAGKKDREPSQPSKLPHMAPEEGSTEDQQIERKVKLVKKFNSKFIDLLRPTVLRIEDSLGSSASRGINTMYHGAVAVVQELHEIGLTEVADIQALGVLNL